jgi:hypothetical protein
MKLILIAALLMAFTTPKPPTFAQKFGVFDQAVYDYTVAKGTGGDTATTRSTMLTAASELSGYDVPAELAKVPPISQYCRWACTGQFYYYCINFAPNSYEAGLCLQEYVNCVRTCGYIPF